MMQGIETEWSEVEKQVAQTALKQAYNRETTALIDEIRNKVEAVSEIEDIWRLHDFLSARRHEIDGKYDDSYSAFIFVFARLVKEKWLSLDELSGLKPDKCAKVVALSRM
jgi:Photoprotection regulator fluorescence recovery protein